MTTTMDYIVLLMMYPMATINYFTIENKATFMLYITVTHAFSIYQFTAIKRSNPTNLKDKRKK